mmetsp:Transcript_14980/g.32181  ORF Transcript_14980/g.32181 Transcript_14980/m.32181 type:complete len:169 (+) Transcript_14980:168-674(+)
MVVLCPQLAARGSAMLSSRSATTLSYRKQCPRDNSYARQPLVIRMATHKEFAQVKGRKAVFKAEKSGSIEVTEGSRKLRDYMSLPPSEYSVLDADKVTRIDEKHFRCELGSINFLGTEVSPVLTAEVNVKPRGEGTVIRVVDAEVAVMLHLPFLYTCHQMITLLQYDT